MVSTLNVIITLSVIGFITALSAPSLAQGIATPDGKPVPSKGLSTDVEYRLRTIRINPLELNGTKAVNMNWTEQRARINARYLQKGIGSFNLQVDVFDGVLAGDNGRFGGDPSSNFGVSISSQRPNVTRWRIGVPEGGDSLDRDTYEPVLEEADALEFNQAYADILLPVGLLRVGRQPIAYGAGLAAHDGGAYNRFGVSQFGGTADRILFGTKLDEGYYAVTRGKDHIADTSLDNGIIFGAFYDFQRMGLPQRSEDNLSRAGATLEYRREEAQWFGWDWRNLVAAVRLVNLDNDEFNTDVWSVPTALSGSIGHFDLKAQYVYIRGSTREISEGFAALSKTEVVEQSIASHGAQVVMDYTIGPATLTMEFDFATGDSDPRPETPITAYSFARDLNVGMLMFEHVLAYESARSTAVGVENLANENTKSFPLTEVQTDGRFTNAIAIFPQIYLRWLDEADHTLHTRLGVLMAWPQADGVVDPIVTTLNRDGDEIRDDSVNFNGGDPGSYYGTEFDLQLGWTFKKHFQWIIEGAYLIPGSSLQDENGDAVNSYMLENRFVFNF